jgi:RimJ/RimL family protein N-acetyltransferase
MKKVDFSFDQDYILENERVVLRPLEPADVQHLSVFSEREPELWQYSLQSAAGIGNLVQYISVACASRIAGHSYPFIIFCKKTQRYAGCTRFYDIDLNNAACLLGYTWIGKDFQRTGLNRHCKWLLFQFAFGQCHFHRVGLRSDVNNTKSIEAMKAIGCVEEGILREHLLLPDGSWRSSQLFSVLQSDWENRMQQKLNQLC